MVTLYSTCNVISRDIRFVIIVVDIIIIIIIIVVVVVAVVQKTYGIQILRVRKLHFSDILKTQKFRLVAMTAIEPHNLARRSHCCDVCARARTQLHRTPTSFSILGKICYN